MPMARSSPEIRPSWRWQCPRSRRCGSTATTSPRSSAYPRAAITLSCCAEPATTPALVLHPPTQECSLVRDRELGLVLLDRIERLGGRHIGPLHERQAERAIRLAMLGGHEIRVVLDGGQLIAGEVFELRHDVGVRREDVADQHHLEARLGAKRVEPRPTFEHVEQTRLACDEAD